MNQDAPAPGSDRRQRRAPDFPPLPDGWSATAPARAPLEGRFTRLVPLNPRDHGAALFDASHGPGAESLWDYMAVGPFADRGTFDTWLKSTAEPEDPLMLTIIDRSSGIPCGMAAFMDIRPAHGGIEIGSIWLSPGLQRTRAATEALYLMMREAMEPCRFLRLQWKCNALNAPSRRAALRLGFRYEGELYAHMTVKGRLRDTTYFSILAEEWPEVSARIAAWLDDANFDAAGRQRQSLSAMMNPDRAN